MKKLLGIVVLGLLWSISAKSDDMSDYIFTNLQQDYSDCYAYFKISEEGVKRSKSDIKDNAALKLKEAAERSLLGAVKTGEFINMKQEAMKARIQLAFEDLSNQMGEDYANISILIVKYADSCNDIVNDPKNRTEYWRSKFKE
jgi:hypothetical protein